MQIKDVTKKYNGKPVVDAVNLEIPKGKVISFIGPNQILTTMLSRQLLLLYLLFQ